MNIFIVVRIDRYVRTVSSLISKTNKYYVLLYLVRRVRPINWSVKRNFIRKLNILIIVILFDFGKKILCVIVCS